MKVRLKIEFLGVCGVDVSFLVKLWSFMDAKAGEDLNWGILGLA